MSAIDVINAGINQLYQPANTYTKFMATPLTSRHIVVQFFASADDMCSYLTAKQKQKQYVL